MRFGQRGIFGDGHHFGVPPQPLEFIKRARFWREDVNQIIAIIGQDPFGVCEAFHADRILAALIELQSNLFHDGLELLGIASATDHEKIREGSHLAQVQNANVEGFLGLGGPNCGEPRGGGKRWCSRLRGRVVLLSDS